MPHIESLLLRADECAQLCGVSRRAWERLKASGQIPPSYKLGNSRVWRRSDIHLWVEWGMPNLDLFTEKLRNLKK
jgi:predicted DNA-binding transcriptional regulator AlpA